MTSNNAMLRVDYEDIWGEVSQKDFGETKPTNEHDRHSVQYITDIMKTHRHSIDHPEQAGISEKRVQVYERRMQVLKKIWIRECQLASSVDPEVPVV